jgi:hypothetical protein
MVFNATFNNNSVISWQLVLLMDETRETEYPEKTTALSQVTDKLYQLVFDANFAQYLCYIVAVNFIDRGNKE